MAESSIIQKSDRVTKERDLTGRSSLVSNVLFTWGGQMVFFVAGFVMPRLIDRKLGQDVLGVWDFSWSLVTYFRLIDLGVTSSVNRYVARYWGKQDIAGVNRVVSSATCALLVAALLVLLATAGAVAMLPYWFGHRLHEHLSVARQSIFCLGAMLAVGTGLGAFNGVLTGCHRWELQSIRLAVWQFITVTAMIVALWLGGGLVALAAITAIGQTLGQLTMVTLAFRVCPRLRLRRSFADWSMIKELYVYSGKILLPSISAMLLNQTISLMIIGHLGPAALAVFTRPRSLLQQIDSLQRKMSMILTPTTSSLESSGDMAEIKNLIIRSVRYSLYLVLPMVMVLVILGGELMWLWMGPAYANGLIPAILAFGFLASGVQTPILSMLEGMNAHGRPGLAQLLAAVCSVLLGTLMLGYSNMGLAGMAVAVTLPLALVNLVYLPWLGCRRLQLNLFTFFRDVTERVWIHLLPFAICLVLVKLLSRNHLPAAIAAMSLGTLSLMIAYWRSVVPGRLKGWVRSYSARASRVVFFLGAKNRSV